MNAACETAPDDFEFELPLFTCGESEALVERVLDLEAFWLARHASLPFHTLGATNYYDITANPARPYERLARQYNPFLIDAFACVYEALLTALGECLRAPVTFLADAALPGFHIFGGHPDFAARPEHDVMHDVWFMRRDGAGFPGNPIHVDTAHRALGLAPGPSGNGHATFSFTLPLGLPRAGAGLRLWSLRCDDVAHLDSACQQQRLQVAPARHIAYRPGTLFLHAGDRFHQARGLPVAHGEYRITLQGHAVWLNQAWRLFW
ncbi:hypothetical protein [Trinickia fusca]|uniref:Prolyl 4-hydroxylase alpha subunit Fe(2+) 2OG dioxygenase domain-containing protein n=1 Tax=Trinickia fusca TaxID=2419777 RepID=A0A494XH04_9BURK|nr:hypothetical protein [Trinickia fusca]RKP46823.1 hypothetical protein D7S89_15775 [Trinickia fusca]